MRVWISGAGGFLGSALTAHLSGSGFRVCAMTSDPEKLRAGVAGRQIEFLDRNAFFRCSADELSGDILVNCAYPKTEDTKGLSSGLDYIAALLRKAGDSGLAGVINISSQSVYSRQREHAADERMTPVLESAYAVGKYMTELLAEASLQQIPHTNIRLASLIGPGYDQRIPNRLVDQVLDGKNLSVREDRQIFGFLDVEDAVNGLELLLKRSPLTWKRVYNLGGTDGCTLKEIGETVRDVMNGEFGFHTEVTFVNADTESNTVVDSSLLTSETGYLPKVSLAESIRRIAEEKMR